MSDVAGNQLSYKEFCDLAKNPCKISKSSETISQKAYESWYYPFEEGKYAVDKQKHGFSVTTLDCAAAMLAYGDTLTMIDTSVSPIKKLGMCNAIIKNTGNNLHEFTMSKFLVSKQYSLRDPNVLAVIIKNATPQTLLSAYSNDKGIDFEKTMRSMDMDNTADLWVKIRADLDRAVHTKGKPMLALADVSKHFDQHMGRCYANTLEECSTTHKQILKKEHSKDISR